MKELSLNLLDIAENSVKAGADLIKLLLTETDELFVMEIIDNGCGMTAEVLKGVTDPFYTTRTTRSVGLGLPLLRLAAEQTGGELSVKSVSERDDPIKHGTAVKAIFYKNHIDFTPPGDLASSLITLIQGHPDRDFIFLHKMQNKTVSLDTRELREQLGEVPLNNYEVISWVDEYLREQYNLQ